MATWAPTLAEVAGCIPTRTANVNLPGEDEYLNTFNTDTRPTGDEAQKVIDHAVSDVETFAATIPTMITPNLESVAKNAAMWRAAADIELAYPDRTADVSIYAQLDARARYEWDAFVRACSSQGTTTGTGIPTWTMPDPVWWGDRNDI